MRELQSLRQIINSYDEALKETFLHRMEVSLLVAKHKLAAGQLGIFDSVREEEVMKRITQGLSPEMSEKARVLWQTLMRISRSRQYDYFIQNDPGLALEHEKQLCSRLSYDGVIVSPHNDAQLASKALGYEITPCPSIKTAIDAVSSGSASFAAIAVDNLYDTEWLYSMIAFTPLYVNAIIRTEGGPIIVVLSKNLYREPENSIVSVAFIIEPRTGTISQSLAVFPEHGLFIEFMRLKKLVDPDLPNPNSLLFVDFVGDIGSDNVRSAILQLQSELPFFRVIGYRRSI